MKYYVDTNILIRYLTKDVIDQAQKVKQRLLQAKEGKIQLVLTSFTAVEILFILENYYELPKLEVIEKLHSLLSPNFIIIDQKEAFLDTLSLYKAYNIDFVDIFNFTVAKKNKAKILSFDKDFDKLTPKLRITP